MQGYVRLQLNNITFKGFRGVYSHDVPYLQHRFSINAKKIKIKIINKQQRKKTFGCGDNERAEKYM